MQTDVFLKGLIMSKTVITAKSSGAVTKMAGRLPAALILVLGLVLVTPALSSAAQYITPDAAKKIAFSNAGVTEENANVIKIARYDKRFTTIYDIDFLTENYRYSYEINAETGEVAAQYMQHIGKIAKTLPQVINQPDATAFISAEQAKNIALEHAGIAAQDIRVFESKLKQKHGYAIYDIEFKANRMEYEYAIDAVTGNILSWESERD